MVAVVIIYIGVGSRELGYTFSKVKGGVCFLVSLVA